MLETSWVQLLQDFKSSCNLDELINSHDKYLAHIKTNALMGIEAKETMVQLKCIFDTIIKFTKIQELVYTAAMRQVHLNKLRDQAQVGYLYLC